VRLYPGERGGRSAPPPGNISPAPVQEQGREETGVPLPPRTAQQSPRNGDAPSLGCTTRRYSTRNPSFAAHGSISERRWYGRMKANRPAAESNRDAAAKSSGSVHVASCRAVSFPGSGFRRPCPARPYGGFDTTRSNEPGSTRGAPSENPRAGRAAVVRAIVAEIPAREVEQILLEVHADAGKHPGREARQEQEQDPAPRPQIEDRTPAIGGGEPREDHRVDREAVPPLRLPDDHYPGTRSSAPTGKMSSPVPIFG